MIAHIPIGLYALPVPLTVVLLAALVVIAASFVLVWRQPANSPALRLSHGRTVPPVVVGAMVVVAWTVVLFIIIVATFGRQGLTVLNGAAVLFWVFLVVALPIAHAFLGGMYEVANPFAYAARLLSGGNRLIDADLILQRIGYWPAVCLTFLLVWGEAISAVVQNPAVLGYAAIAYAGIQVSCGVIFGDAWYRGGDVFQALTALASQVAVLALRRVDGRVELVVGRGAAGPLRPASGLQALITLWLAGVLADGIRATPLWRNIILPPLTPAFQSMGTFAGVDVGSTLEITLEIVITWVMLVAFFWAFLALVSLVAARPGEPRVSRKRRQRYGALLAPTLIPISLGYLFAHNLTELLVVGPLLVTARDASPAQINGLVQQQVNAISPNWVWWVQACAIVLGHVVAVIMAHDALSQRPRDTSSLETS
ncbi:MAG: hypothetical protein JOY80_12815, partial [Candidatus Dormibacteraeota bacterium]|nr:hypothetical protein [Candidatus Dormibacteraeota bacterium]